MAKDIYDYRDAEGFLPHKRFDEWCQRNKLQQAAEGFSRPRWDGIYATEEVRYKSYNEIDAPLLWQRSYLRFYPDGTVLYEYAVLRALPDPKQMARVFKKEEKAVKDRGSYRIRGWQIAFEITIIEPKLGLLRVPKRTKRPFLGACLAKDGSLYLATFDGRAEEYEFTFVKEYQQELQSQGLTSSTPAPSIATRTPIQPLSPSAQQVVSQLKNEGERHFSARSYALALPLYEQIISIDPTNDDALFNQGICLSRLGSHEQSLAAYERACLLKPLNALYHISRGEELMDLQRLQGALQAYQEALQLEPHLGAYRNLRAWQGLSETLQKLGRTREAQEAEQQYEQSHLLYVSGGQQTVPSSSQVPASLLSNKVGTTFVTYHQPGSKVDGLAWSPDGGRIVSFGLGEAVVWEPLSGRVLYDYKVKGFTTFITAIAWSPDSTRIATAGSDKVVQVWDASNGQVITAYKGGHNKLIRCLSWSPHGMYIASCDDNDIHIWGAMSGQHTHIFPVHSKALVGVRPLAWSPDGTWIASGGGDNHVTVWNPENGSAIFTYTQQQNTVNGLAWSPDSKRIVSASHDKTIHIWAVETGAESVICKGHTKGVKAVVFSPDGGRIASASDDGTIRIWNSETGQHLFTYAEHQKGVTSLAWSPDGRYIASGGADKAVHVWACG